MNSDDMNIDYDDGVIPLSTLQRTGGVVQFNGRWEKGSPVEHLNYSIHSVVIISMEKKYMVDYKHFTFTRSANSVSGKSCGFKFGYAMCTASYINTAAQRFCWLPSVW